MGLFDSIKNIGKKNKPFTQLDLLIHNGGNHIQLESNFILKKQSKIFSKGINVFVDDMVIDGNGYVIDAQNNAPIFRILAKNITIKNLTFKGGYSWNTAGAIFIEKGATCNLVDCKFLDNTDAIINDGIIKIVNCQFKNNKSNDNYSDIFNRGNLILKDNIFNSKSKSIKNNKIMVILDEVFEVNKLISDNGIIQHGISINNATKTFDYLNMLIINKNDENIELNKDINFALDELNDYNFKDGIEIARNNLIIDGTCHSINANNVSNIFKISGKNIIFKNIIFKKGYSKDGSPIELYENSHCEFIKCTFDACSIDIQDGSHCIINDCGFEDCKQAIKVSDDSSCEIMGSRFEDCFNSAISNEGNLEINNSEFNENLGRSGGAINNSGKLKIINSIFKNNHAIPGMGGGSIIRFSYGNNHKDECNNGKGGAIYNSGELEIKDSNFIKNYVTGENDSGAAINNAQGYISLFNCVFSHPGNIEYFSHEIGNFHNVSRESRNIIENHDYLDVSNCTFNNIDAKMIFYNANGANLHIEYGKFIENRIIVSIVYNDGQNCNLTNCIFDGNTYSFNNYILNNTIISLNKINIKNENSLIINSGKLIFKKISDKIEENVENTGEIINVSSSDIENRYDFNHLNNLIQNNGDNEVHIKNDIRFEEYEIDFYEGGIELTKDNLVIDGNNNVIDGNGLSRIFIICGKNITLKNIIFKNAHVFSNRFNISKGGSLLNTLESKLILENCKFINCSSEKEGGALYNRGEVDIINSKFNENFITSKLTSSEGSCYGGAICNCSGKIKIIQTEIYESRINAEDGRGGAIYNDCGEIEICDSEINDNHIECEYGYGGAICNNESLINISSSVLKNNIALKKGGAIFNLKGIIEINNCMVEANDTIGNSNDIYFVGGYGGSIYNEEGDMSIEKSSFKSNKSSEGGGAIYNTGKININDSNFNGNYTNWNEGGSISNNGVITLKNSKFIGNSGKFANGGAIHNSKKLQIFDCCFDRNRVNEDERYNKGGCGGAINNVGELILANTNFRSNVARTYHFAFDGYFGIGGAICNEGKIQADDVSFLNNKADNKCGAIYSIKDNLKLKNCIFKNNVPDDGDF